MAVSFTDYMVALRSSGLPGPARSVALWIATRCANDWLVTTETIAGDSGFSKATVKRHIATLELMGWIKRRSDRIRGNRYELLIPNTSLAQSEPTYTRTYKNKQKPRAYARTRGSGWHHQVFGSQPGASLDVDQRTRESSRGLGRGFEVQVLSNPRQQNRQRQICHGSAHE